MFEAAARRHEHSALNIVISAIELLFVMVSTTITRQTSAGFCRGFSPALPGLQPATQLLDFNHLHGAQFCTAHLTLCI
jgi:hypothetical protein